MKKLTCFITGICLVSVLLSGCGNTASQQAPVAQTNSNVQVQSNEPAQVTQEPNENTKELLDEIEFGTHYEDESGTNQSPIKWKMRPRRVWFL